MSSAADARTASSAAASQAVAGRTGALLIVSGDAGRDPVELAAGITAVAPGVPVIGGNVAGELSRNGSSSGRVLVVAFGGDDFSVATGCGQAGAGPAEAAEQAAQCLARVEGRPHQVVLMLSDATIGDQQEVLRGAYRTAGAGVPLVGGVCPVPAGSEFPWQLHDGRVLRGAVVAAALGSTGPFGIGVGHGWEPVGEPMLVTASCGNQVHELDDQPALTRYLQHLSSPGLPWSAPGGVEERTFDTAAFVRAAVLHPLGLRRRNGALIRSVVGAEPETGSLLCAAEVPQGALVWLMHGSAASVLAGMGQACEQALAAVGAVGSARAPAVGLLAFDCVARQRILLADQPSEVAAGGGAGVGGLQQEAARLAVHAGSAPFAGVYTAGEIARVQGLSDFHNKTVAVLAVG